MKLELKIRSGAQIRTRLLELTEPDSPAGERGQLRCSLDGEPLAAEWAEISPGVYSILLEGQSYEAHVATRRDLASNREASLEIAVGKQNYEVEIRDPRERRHGGPALAPGGPQEISAPMPGKIVKILAAENQEVQQGEGLLVVEAMKMQNELRAPRAGRVEKIYVQEGIGVEAGSKLLRLV